MWNLSLPWWEFLLRATLVYAFLILILRLTGKRQVGQLAPFDLVLLLVLSNALQNSMNGGDNSLLGGMVSALALVLLNWLVGYLTFRSKKLARLVEGRPQVLIHNGHVYRDVMERNQLTQSELDAALRLAGCGCVADVHFAILENNGQISVRTHALPRNSS
ncbi:MAG TPA: YetF domain-containing protein [Steroidobacteraceae bacterium]|nr:YetF domain-containing protein [Steroidobacteraceae bacterium]